MKNKIKNHGFSLAEVLLAVAVLAVVGACSVPVINIKMQETTMVSKLKKTYALLNNSYQRALSKYGSPKYWGLNPGVKDTTTDTATFEDNEKFYLRLLEGLKYEYVADVLPPQPTNYLNNKDKAVNNPDGFERQPIFRLSDGTTFFHSWYVGGCTSNQGTFLACGDFTVDLNGADGPNVIGIDQFLFFYSETGLVPVGYKGHSRTVETHCMVNDTVVYNGYGCTAWVIEKGTMPWLRGKQVSWDD